MSPLVSTLLALLAVYARTDGQPPPEAPSETVDDPGAAPPPSARPRAVDAALGTPPADAREDPNTSDDPGYADRRRKAAPDKSYGSTAKTTNPDGTVVDGLQIYGDETLPPDEQYEPEDVPEVHVVQDGDTLWGISDRYMRDPYQWPRVWSWNEQVTNPHWIFPGDRIRLRDPKDDDGRYGDADGDGDGRGGTGGRDGRGRGRGKGESDVEKTRIPPEALQDTYVLNQTVFVDAAKFETSMKVIGGGEANVLMSTRDTAYMSYKKGHAPVPGERLVAYAPQEKVYSLKDRKVLGYIVQVVGEIDIKSVAPKAAEGTIAVAWHPVERGYRVGPLRRVYKRVDTKETEKSNVGVIVATLNEAGPMGLRNKRRRKSLLGDHVLVGEVQFVVMDLGTSDGVQVGQMLEVVRKGDEYTKKRVFKIPYEKCWPRRVIGAILVLQVQQETSFGAAVYTRREIERGDHVEMRGRKPLPEDTEKCDEDDEKKGKRRGKKAKAEGKAEADDGEAKGTFTVGGK